MVSESVRTDLHFRVYNISNGGLHLKKRKKKRKEKMVIKTNFKKKNAVFQRFNIWTWGSLGSRRMSVVAAMIT